MKAISYSLFGDAPLYTVGMRRNAVLARELFPDWKVFCWCGPRTDISLIDELTKLGVEICIGNGKLFPNGKFWRFLIHDEPDVERFIVRDADSRLSARDRRCVEEWEASGKGLHVIRDHPYHTLKVMGGLWGLKPGKIQSLSDLMQPFAHKVGRDVDQPFLSAHLWPLYAGDRIQHDSCRMAGEGGECLPLPVDPDDPHSFLGEVIDEHENPNSEHRLIRDRKLNL